MRELGGRRAAAVRRRRAGTAGSGKTTLVRSLVKHYTRHALNEIKGPLTLVTGKKRRIQIMEVKNDLNDMVDGEGGGFGPVARRWIVRVRDGDV